MRMQERTKPSSTKYAHASVAAGAMHELKAVSDDVRDEVTHIRQKLPKKDHPGSPSNVSSAENVAYLLTDCLLSSVLLYAFSAGRQLVRDGKLDLPFLLDLPTARNEFAKQCRIHRQMIEEAMPERELYVGIWRTLGGEDAQEIEGIPSSQLEAHQVGEEGSFLMAIGDANAQEELVYSIDMDTRRKFVCLTFRGSVTLKDWVVDSNPFMLEARDASVVVCGREDKRRKTVCIHKGFYNYLMKAPKGKSSKYEEVLDLIKQLLNDNEGFQLRVTGHSLGGALATLFTFYASEEEWMPSIQCVSFGAPRVGNLDFLRAFRRLERISKVSMIRVVNHRDVIPRMPDRLGCISAFCPGSIFRHVGIEIRMFSSDKVGKKFSIHASRVHQSYSRQVMQDLPTGIKRSVTKTCLANLFCIFPCFFGTGALTMHSCKEYMDRFQRDCKDYENMSLPQLYTTSGVEREGE